MSGSYDSRRVTLCAGLCATFLTYCAAAKLAQDLGENCCVPFCVPGWLVVLRTKFRTQMNIEVTTVQPLAECFSAVSCVWS